jgi:hypothetical protein
MTKGGLSDQERKAFELKLTGEFASHKEEGRRDLTARINGVAARAGATGFQFAGYTTLERMYRGDQWIKDEPAGASQRTDNYCAVIVDSLSGIPFDDAPEINCPTDDPTDDILEIKAELKEKLLWKAWKDNEFEVIFDSWAKVGSLYGDGFLIGPWMEKNKAGVWEIKFRHAENPGSITPIYSDNSFTKLIGFIEHERLSMAKAEAKYGKVAKDKGIKLMPSLKSSNQQSADLETNVPMVDIDCYWTDEVKSVFIEDKLLEYYFHNWDFVPLSHVKNIHSPNWAYGKSDLEDVLDPQLMHNRVNNDLANLLKWVSSINLWGKNVEGMQALVAGLSRIYSVPEDGELHAFEKTGDPYITNTFAQQRRGAIIDISGVSEQLLSGSQVANASGRALALAFQGTIRKLNPRIKRYRVALQQLNRNILKLYEIYYPETKKIIMGDYRNEVFMPATLLRNIVDTINKLQSGIISQDTAMREAGVAQPNLEKKLMKKDLTDPILGPQIARQPALLPRLSEGQNQPGETPMPAPGNQPGASQGGAVASVNQSASGAAPVPVTA